MVPAATLGALNRVGAGVAVIIALPCPLVLFAVIGYIIWRVQDRHRAHQDLHSMLTHPQMPPVVTVGHMAAAFQPTSPRVNVDMAATTATIKTASFVTFQNDDNDDSRMLLTHEDQ